MTKADLDQVFEWRNHPDVRRFMFTTSPIQWREHATWFERCQHEPRLHLMIFETDGTPSGFVNLREENAGRIGKWGFYVAPSSPKGIGSRLGRAAIDHAFAICGFHKLEGQAIAFNQRSAALHQRLGFRQEGALRDHFFDGTSYFNVLCFGLLRSEWFQAAKEEQRP